jgi:hypothetical protein
MNRTLNLAVLLLCLCVAVPALYAKDTCNGVARARSDRSVRVRLSDAWSSISTNRRDNARWS